MIVFKITEQKFQENTGKLYDRYFRTLRYNFSILGWIYSTFFITTFLLIVLVWLVKLRDLNSKLLWPMFILLFGGLLLIIILAQISFKFSTLDLLVSKIKYLVNDPELIWLNLEKKPENINYELNSKKKLKLGRSNKIITPENFLTLAYLKKEGTSQGLYPLIRGWKNSNTANVNLKRLARDKQIICMEENGDFSYIEWRFKVIDEKGNFRDDRRAKKIEKILNIAWNRMLIKELDKSMNK